MKESKEITNLEDLQKALDIIKESFENIEDMIDKNYTKKQQEELERKIYPRGMMKKYSWCIVFLLAFLCGCTTIIKRDCLSSRLNNIYCVGDSKGGRCVECPRYCFKDEKGKYCFHSNHFQEDK